MKNRRITGIVACDAGSVIANDSKIPWSCPADVLFFRKMTEGQIIVTGMTTFLNLSDKFLKQRFCIAFSKDPKHKDKYNSEYVRIVNDVNEFLSLKNIPEDKSVYMIGGGEMSRLFLENGLLDNFFLTKITGFHPGDTFFPSELLNNYPRSLIHYGIDYAIFYYMTLSKAQRA